MATKKVTAPKGQKVEEKNSYDLPFDIVIEDGHEVSVYKSDTDTSLAFAFYMSHQGQLNHIDYFIHDLPNEAPVKDWMIKLRGEAVTYFLRRDNRNDMVRFAIQKLCTIHERMISNQLQTKYLPLAIKGESFSRGRQKGAVGYFRQLIRNILNANPRITNDELWVAVKSNRPKGWGKHWKNVKEGEFIAPGDGGVYDDDQFVGKKFAIPDVTADEKRFTKKSMCVYASQERKRLASGSGN